jgi:hypothetical protein
VALKANVMVQDPASPAASTHVSADDDGFSAVGYAEPAASEPADEKSDRHQRAAKISELFTLLREEGGPCANLKRLTKTWGSEHVVKVNGLPALVLAPGTVLTVDEEGRWTCAIRYALQYYCTSASWTLRFAFRTRCGTELVTLGECWTFKAGKGWPQTTEPIWADPYKVRNAYAAIRVDQNREFFPLLVDAKGVGGESEYRVEVRSGVSPGLRRDFTHIDKATMRVGGLFRMDIGNV